MYTVLTINLGTYVLGRAAEARKQVGRRMRSRKSSCHTSRHPTEALDRRRPPRACVGESGKGGEGRERDRG